jgi:hypothetical protein
MKKGIILFIITSVMAIGSSFGQSSWSGFFKPLEDIYSGNAVSTVIKGKYTLDSIVPAKYIYFRPYFNVTGTQIQFTKGVHSPKESYFSLTGIGISYAKYTTLNGQPWANLTGNLFATIPTTSSNNFGIGGSAGLFNNLISFGGVYTPNPPAGYCKGSIIVDLSYNF